MNIDFDQKLSCSTNKIKYLYKVSLVLVSPSSNAGSTTYDPNWTSRKNSLVILELSSIDKVSVVKVSSCSNIGSIRDDPYWTSR